MACDKCLASRRFNAADIKAHCSWLSQYTIPLAASLNLDRPTIGHTRLFDSQIYIRAEGLHTCRPPMMKPVLRAVRRSRL